MRGHEGATGDGSSTLVILDCLGFVQDYTLEVHLVEYASALVVCLLPPSNLLLGSLALNRRLILRVRLHNLTIRREDDIVALKNPDGYSRIRAGASAITHDFHTTAGMLFDFTGPLGQQRRASYEKRGLRSLFGVEFGIHDISCHG